MNSLMLVKMSQERFVTRYAGQSQISVEELLSRYVPVHCNCAKRYCKGFQMVPRDQGEQNEDV